MNNSRFNTDGTKAIPNVIYIIVIAIIALVGLTSQATTKQGTVISPEYRESVYRNFTIIEDNYNNQGFLSVVEIDLDDISSIISKYNLPYYNIKGE